LITGDSLQLHVRGEVRAHRSDRDDQRSSGLDGKNGELDQDPELMLEKTVLCYTQSINILVI